MIKVLVLAVALGLFVPLAVWLRGGAVFGRRIWILFGFLPFLLPAVPHLDVGIVSWGADWPGLLNGLELTIIDILAAAIYVGLPRGRGDAAFRVFLGLYFAAVVLSVFQADEPVAASFYVWQFARAILLTTVVFRACADEIVLGNLCKGMVLGLALQAVVVIWQRFGLGIVQTSGTFFHQNTLGLVTHFVVFPQVALLLAGQRGWQVVVTPLAGIVVVALTASRGALLYAALGIALIFAISALRHWTFRKSILAVAGGLLLLAFAPIVATSFEKRFEAAPLMEDEYDERAAFKRTAAYILEDHPFGVGVNHYVYMAKNFGYSDRGGVAPVEGSRNNIVHNVYWLTAAETGYVGLVALVLMLAYPLVAALQVGWRTRGDPRGDLLLGLGVALLMVYGHSTIEYILLAKEAQYLQAMIVGITLGLVGQLRKAAGPAAAGTGWPVAALAGRRPQGA